jgi:hypothetical protein
LREFRELRELGASSAKLEARFMGVEAGMDARSSKLVSAVSTRSVSQLVSNPILLKNALDRYNNREAN